MTQHYQVDIVVVGAGMVGSACAASIGRQGFDVLLLDRQAPVAYQPQTLPDLRVSAIAPGSQAMLDELGAWHMVQTQRCCAYDVMEVTTGSGGQLRFAASEHGLSQLGWIVENRLLSAALTQEMPNTVTRVDGVSVSGLAQRRRAVELMLDDGSRVSARLCVAADGARSSIRDMCELDVNAHDYQQRALVAVLETEHANPGIAWQVHLDTGPLAMLPVGEGRSSLVWSLPQAMAADKLQADSEQLAAELTLHSNGRFGQVRVVSKAAAFPLRMQLVRQMVSQRVVLVGDAAHQVHPMAGQGVNLGFQDVRELSELLAAQPDVLAASQQGNELQTVLATYERRRLSENTITARGIDTLEKLFRRQQMLSALGISAVHRLRPLKELFIRRACAIPAAAAEVNRSH